MSISAIPDDEWSHSGQVQRRLSKMHGGRNGAQDIIPVGNGGGVGETGGGKMKTTIFEQ